MVTTIDPSIAHLYRRAGFGGTPSDLTVGTAAGYAATVDRLLDRGAPDDADAVRLPDLIPLYFGPTPTTAQTQQITTQRQSQARLLTLWWLDRMATSSSPWREKLTWFWHNHFATSNEKVDSPPMMYAQNQYLRTNGHASFEALTQGMAKDPAMMVWLDSNTNRKGRPNENFSRELMELFTLGIGNYSDADVREAARSFTGWTVDRSAISTSLVQAQADYDTKTLLGQTGAFRADEVISLLVHQPFAAAHVTRNLWSRLVYPVLVDDPVVAELAPAFAADLDATKLVRSIFKHPKFVSADAKTGLVKEPVEWVVGTLRALGLTATQMDSGNPSILTTLDLLGQRPFLPPSVGGWGQNTYWLSTQTSLARQRFAQAIAARADLSWLDPRAPTQSLDALATRLGIEKWTPNSLAALAATTTAKSLVAIALTTPEFVLN